MFFARSDKRRDSVIRTSHSPKWREAGLAFGNTSLESTQAGSKVFNLEADEKSVLCASGALILNPSVRLQVAINPRLLP